MKPQIKFKYYDTWFLVPDTVVHRGTIENKLLFPELRITRQLVADMGKQYVKTHFPKYKTWGISESFANGSSSTLYVSKKNGDNINQKDFKQIEDFFLSMEYYTVQTYGNAVFAPSEDEYVTSKGNKIVFQAKYTHVMNGPKFGSFEWAIKEIREGKILEDIEYCLSKSVVKKVQTA